MALVTHITCLNNMSCYLEEISTFEMIEISAIINIMFILYRYVDPELILRRRKKEEDTHKRSFSFMASLDADA